MLCSSSLFLAARMLSWVVKVVPQPPEILPKNTEDQKAKPALPPVSVIPPPQSPLITTGTLGNVSVSVNIPQQEKRVTFEDEVKHEGKNPGSEMGLLCSGFGHLFLFLKIHLLFVDSPKK